MPERENGIQEFFPFFFCSSYISSFMPIPQGIFIPADSFLAKVFRPLPN
jgi:hypothetical protein